LRPLTFFSPVEAAFPTPSRRLHRLAVADGRTRLPVAPSRLAHRFPEPGIQPFPGAVVAPLTEVLIDRGLGREIVRQRLPGGTGPHDIHDGVDHRPQIHVAESPPFGAARLGRGQIPRQTLPLLICKVGGVKLPAQAPEVT
jgi:hypothetical protein